METDVIVALVSLGGSIVVAAASIVSVVVTNRKTTASINAKMETNQAVMQTEIAELTREVRDHNNFARRMPVVEEQIKVINHRIADLEADRGGEKPPKYTSNLDR